MPALVLFQRRWRVASDDFVYDGFLYTFIGVIWIIVFGLELPGFSDSCDDPLRLKDLVVGFLVVESLSVINNAWIAVISARGTINNAQPRKWISIGLYARGIISVAELILTIKSALLFLKDPVDCISPVVVGLLKAAAVAFMIILLVRIINALWAFDPLGKRKFLPTVEEEENRVLEKTYMLWKSRCKLFAYCCIWESSAKNAFEDIAKLFATFFWDMDWVASDVLAGLILLYKRYILHPPQSHSPVNTAAPLWMTIESAQHFFKYAIASYGMLMLILNQPCCWPFNVCGHLKCCCSRDASHIEDLDDPCGFHKASLKNLAGIKNGDLLYVCSRNRVYQVPFYVALDHQEKAIVIAIRGSWTVRDLLTDLNAECEPLQFENAPSESVAHRGMLKAATYVYDRLNNKRVIEEALDSHPDYNIIAIGHSLGAGVAALLGLLMRAQYPQIRCYLYSPPGGLVSTEVAMLSEQFMMSVILGCDFIPRLGIATMENLKSSLIDVLCSCDKPKYKVLASGLWKVFFPEEEELIEDPERIPMVRGSFNTSYHTINCGRSAPALYAPGRILHLVRSNTHSEEETVVYACWRKASFFDRILITPCMWTDHLPISLSKALDSACKAKQSTTINSVDSENMSANCSEGCN
ncbi:hypothetical protein CHUAL_001535 [Chamberlinius hualienensis]